MDKSTFRLALLFCLFGGVFDVASADEPASVAAGVASKTSAASIRPITVFARNVADVIWQVPNRLTRTAKTPYSWQWLATRYDFDGDQVITPGELFAPPKTFHNLDRDWDGKLTQTDLDWSADGILDRQKETTFTLFRTTDQNSDGQLTAKEWQALFDSATAGKGFLNDADLEQLVFRKLPEMRRRRDQTLTERAQDRWRRFHEIYESGKLFTDGPEPGDLAPDFVLRSPDGKSQVQLSSFRNKKPVVLIFGSFT